MIRRGLIYFCMLIAMVIYSTIVFAAHPLITDDTGTQGKGKFQVEANCEFSYDKNREEGVKIKEIGWEIATIFSYGILDNIDIVLGMPYKWFRVEKDSELVAKERGISDLSLEVKWRFYEKDGFSFALKPGITFPTGEEEKGLGSGRPSFGLTFISTKEIGMWAFHLNAGYTRNGYKLREDKEANRKDIWHVSIASELEVIKNLKLVYDMGMERNSEKTSNTHPAFILGGVIYSITKNIDIDFGVKAGLNKPETDVTFLGGIAFRF